MSASVFNARAEGAIGDSVADDTAAIQAILDGFSKPFSTGVLDLPGGTYRITRPLVYRGDYGYGVRICGTASAAQPSGTVLKWDGPPGEAVLSLRGCTSTTVEHLAINCGNARTGISIEFDEASGKGTSGVYLDHLFISGGTGPMSSAIVAGYRVDGSRDDRQCDKIVVSNSLLNGSGTPGTTRYGVLLGWANCKNFAVRDCGIVGFGTGIKFGGSGYCVVDGFAGGLNTIADFEAATGNMEIRAGNSEQSTRLLAGSTGANSGSVSISNFSWSGWSGDDPIVSYQGFLKLEGNYLRNTTSDGKKDAVPRVVLNATPGGPFSCVSNGNFYRLATGSPPITDTNGRPLAAGRLQSFGDYGGTEGDLAMLRLPPSAIANENGAVKLNVAAGSGQSGTWFGNGKGEVTGLVTGEGAWMFVHIADAVAPNQSIFLGGQHNGLPCYKDKDGQVFLLDLSKPKKGQ